MIAIDGDRSMAGLTIVVAEFGKHALAVAALDLAQELFGGAQLTSRPQAQMRGHGLAPTVIGVGQKVIGLQRAVGVKFETQARMTGTVQGMAEHALVVTLMAGQTQGRARRGLIGRIEAGGDIAGVLRGGLHMGRQKLAAGSMAGLATDTVFEAEFRSALGDWHIGGVAAQALRCLARVFDAELVRNRASGITGQRRESLGVFVVRFPHQAFLHRHRGIAPSLG